MQPSWTVSLFSGIWVSFLVSFCLIFIFFSLPKNGCPDIGFPKERFSPAEQECLGKSRENYSGWIIHVLCIYVWNSHTSECDFALTGIPICVLTFPLGKSPENPKTFHFSRLWEGNSSQFLSAPLIFNLSPVSLLYLDCADP